MRSRSFLLCLPLLARARAAIVVPPESSIETLHQVHAIQHNNHLEHNAGQGHRNVYVDAIHGSADNDANEIPNSDPPSREIPDLTYNLESEEDIHLEITKLRQLELKLKGIQRVIDGQKRLVDNLSETKSLNASATFKQCDSLSCYLETIYHKTKDCIQETYARYGPLPDSVSGVLKSAIHDSGNVTRAVNSTIFTLSESDATSNPTTASTYHTSLLSTQSHLTCHARMPAVHLALDITAALLSLICITCYISIRIRDPRRRAERAARREERETAKAYRRLARKQAWKNWWNGRFWVRDQRRGMDDGRIRDYEEKRELIRAQEMLLEGAMQNEIRRLRGVHENGDVDDLVGAEEGRATRRGGVRDGGDGGAAFARSRTSSEGAPPPTYRSRASSSGRPPSYKAFSKGRGIVLVPDGLGGYMTSGSGSEYTPSGTVRTSEETDRTPDSSVVSLSPRQSLETLRTERSAL